MNRYKQTARYFKTKKRLSSLSDPARASLNVFFKLKGMKFLKFSNEAKKNNFLNFECK